MSPNTFHSDNFQFVIDINGKADDRDIWEYAKVHDLVILTKDSDFYDRCLIDAGSPKVIYFKVGNMLLKELYQFFHLYWDQIISYLPTAKMIIVSQAHIEIMPL
ncbi:DUF5615 family PIN-like protein [Runella sp.]|uniref:DUF5615 family PIN-like protein n=1 Tax=Runella sp. TaxID=1960881 RepID=UPI003D0E28F4